MILQKFEEAKNFAPRTSARFPYSPSVFRTLVDCLPERIEKGEERRLAN